MPDFIIVDDNEQNLYLLQSLLEGHGHKVESALNGEDALKKARQNPPDMIISDILMPVMDGFTLCREWKQDSILKKIPFVFYTATYTDKKDEELAVKEGADRFIRMPVEPDEFIRIIGNMTANLVQYKARPKKPSPGDEKETFALYSKRLVRKLEKKMLELKQEISERKRAEDALKKAKKEIEAWNNELEARVREKTDELIKSQAQLIQAAKLSAIGRIAAGLTHELNSPLTGLMPLIDKHKEKAAGRSGDYREFTLMHDACEHMAKIIRDFGSISKGSQGRRRELDLNEVIEDTLSFCIDKLTNKGIQVIKEYDKDLPKVEGEKSELQQVVLNMVTNAGDAMRKDGIFTIKTGMSGSKGMATMEFIDNGTGIRKEHLDKIFDPFFTTKKTGEGAGLGLSVAYGIIKEHGGNIRVESVPGKGTRFIIQIPASKSKPKTTKSRHLAKGKA